MASVKGRLEKLEREAPRAAVGEPTVTICLPRKDGDTTTPLGERIEPDGKGGSIRWVIYELPPHDFTKRP